MRITIFCLALFSLQGAIAGGIEVVDGWIPEPPPAAKTHAAYFVLENHRQHEIELVDVSSSCYKKIMMHRSVMENAVVSMRHVLSVKVLAGERAVFEPGGLHLMMIGFMCQQRLSEGVEFKFTFADGSELTKNFTMKLWRNNESE